MLLMQLVGKRLWGWLITYRNFSSEEKVWKLQQTSDFSTPLCLPQFLKKKCGVGRVNSVKLGNNWLGHFKSTWVCCPANKQKQITELAQLHNFSVLPCSHECQKKPSNVLLGGEVASHGEEDRNHTAFNCAARGCYRIAVFFWALLFEV